MPKKHGKKIYIGLVGEIGGGKDTVMQYVERLLPQKRVAHIRFSDPLSETLALWVLPKTRANYQKLSPIMVDTYGPSTLANIVRERALKAQADIIFLNGVRWWADFRMLRGIRGRDKKNILVYVTAPARIRYERLKKRGEKAGEKTMSFRRFLKEQKPRADANIPKIGKKADLTIENSGTMEAFKRSIAEKLIPVITKNI